MSGIIDESNNNKILSYFPADKRNFEVTCLYSGARDGWSKETFKSKVFFQGPLLVLIKTTNNVICGGYTDASWTTTAYYAYSSSAFVFNMS